MWKYGCQFLQVWGFLVGQNTTTNAKNKLYCIFSNVKKFLPMGKDYGLFSKEGKMVKRDSICHHSNARIVLLNASQWFKSSKNFSRYVVIRMLTWRQRKEKTDTMQKVSTNQQICHLKLKQEPISRLDGTTHASETPSSHVTASYGGVSTTCFFHTSQALIIHWLTFNIISRGHSPSGCLLWWRQWRHRTQTGCCWCLWRRSRGSRPLCWLTCSWSRTVT